MVHQQMLTYTCFIYLGTLSASAQAISVTRGALHPSLLTEILPIAQRAPMPAPSPPQRPWCLHVEPISPLRYRCAALTFTQHGYVGMGLPLLRDWKLEAKFEFIFGLLDVWLNCTE